MPKNQNFFHDGVGSELLGHYVKSTLIWLGRMEMSEISFHLTDEWQPASRMPSFILTTLQVLHVQVLYHKDGDRSTGANPQK